MVASATARSSCAHVEMHLVLCECVCSLLAPCLLYRPARAAAAWQAVPLAPRLWRVGLAVCRARWPAVRWCVAHVTVVEVVPTLVAASLGKLQKKLEAPIRS